MDWLQERDIIIPKCNNYRDFGYSDNFSKKIRNEILSKNNYTCRFCGGIYPKYLICSYISYAKCNDVLCRACYLVTHLNSGLFEELQLYYSIMPQCEIIRKTVDYIINNNEIPLPTKIDNDIKLLPISLLEFINILNNDEVPDELNNYKLFFTHKFNIDFISNNYGNQMVKFIDTNKENKKKIKNNTINHLNDILVKHIPSEEELTLFNKYYSVK